MSPPVNQSELFCILLYDSLSSISQERRQQKLTVKHIQFTQRRFNKRSLRTRRYSSHLEKRSSEHSHSAHVTHKRHAGNMSRDAACCEESKAASEQRVGGGGWHARITKGQGAIRRSRLREEPSRRKADTQLVWEGRLKEANMAGVR